MTKTRWALIVTVVLAAMGMFIGLYITNPFDVQSADPLVRLFGFGTYEVATRSMAPTLVPGDQIFSNVAPYRRAEPSRGDVIVGQLHDHRAIPFVARVVGLPGETISVEAGKIMIDGEPLEEPYLDPGSPPAPNALDISPRTIPEGTFFVLGDNRGEIDDHRLRGMLQKDDVMGKVSLILMSDDFRRIGKVR